MQQLADWAGDFCKVTSHLNCLLHVLGQGRFDETAPSFEYSATCGAPCSPQRLRLFLLHGTSPKLPKYLQDCAQGVAAQTCIV